jgi:hypothetical protein
MTRIEPDECVNTRPAPIITTPHNCKARYIPMTKAKNSTTKIKSESIALRDALPFFKKGRGNVATSWWNVTLSGNYAADLETGMAYAKAFLPMLTFNSGAADLGAIVSDMAKAGRDPVKNPKDWRGIDNVALGFLMGIGGSLQSAMASISIAAIAIETPSSDLGPKFIELVKRGGALEPARFATLYHDPGATIFSRKAAA